MSQQKKKYESDPKFPDFKVGMSFFISCKNRHTHGVTGPGSAIRVVDNLSLCYRLKKCRCRSSSCSSTWSLSSLSESSVLGALYVGSSVGSYGSTWSGMTFPAYSVVGGGRPCGRGLQPVNGEI